MSERTDNDGGGANPMSTLERALLLATGAHADQVDKGGEPYILHPLRVMLRLRTAEERIVALLHDVVEDTEWTLEDLAREGFSETVLRAIDAVTRRPEEDYEQFVRRAGVDPIGRRVKLADLRDNADLSRIPQPSERDLERVAKYERAIAILEAMERANQVPEEEQ
jgi:hypothetical protein